AARTRLPRLLPLLDGSRTVEEVAAELGPEIRPAIDNALALLAEHGLLTGPPPYEPLADRRRTLELLRATGAGEHAQAALRQASVSVLGEAPLAAEIGRLLQRSGVGEVGRTWEADLVVAAPGADEAARLEEWNATALERRVPWLQLVPFDGTLAAIGPLFVPGETGCHVCFRLRRAVDPLAAVEQPLCAHNLSAPALDAAIGGVAVAAVLRWLTAGDTAALGAVLALECEPHLALTRHVVYRVPRCPACSPLAGQALVVPWSSEAAVAA
ncbi:MAG: TOMM precursor leader peptide-binding protein, partial [Gaiellaceae bacterium]